MEFEEVIERELEILRCLTKEELMKLVMQQRREHTKYIQETVEVKRKISDGLFVLMNIVKNVQ